MTTSDPRQMTLPGVAAVDRDQAIKEAVDAIKRAFDGANEEEKSKALKAIDDVLMKVSS